MTTIARRLPLMTRRDCQREPESVLKYAVRDECTEASAGTLLAIAEAWDDTEFEQNQRIVESTRRCVAAMLTEARCLNVPVDLAMVLRFKRAKHEFDALKREQSTWKHSMLDMVLEYERRVEEIYGRAWRKRYPLDNWYWYSRCEQ